MGSKGQQLRRDFCDGPAGKALHRYTQRSPDSPAGRKQSMHKKHMEASVVLISHRERMVRVVGKLYCSQIPEGEKPT